MTRDLTAAEIIDLAQQAPSRDAFRLEALAQLQQRIGSDIALFHDLEPRPLNMGTCIGVERNFFEKARDANGSDYACQMLVALQSGRAIIDEEFFGRQRLWRFSFFNEVLRPSGLESVLYGLVQFRGASPSLLAFGRSPSTKFRSSSPGVVEQLLPALTIADAALANTERWTPALPREELTPRQHELVSYVGLGLTNAMIATAMGISPNTVRNLLAGLYARLGVSNRAELLRVVYHDFRDSQDGRAEHSQA